METYDIHQKFKPQRNLYSVINNIFYDITIFFMTKNSEVQSMPQGVLILSLLFSYNVVVFVALTIIVEKPHLFTITNGLAQGQVNLQQLHPQPVLNLAISISPNVF